MPEDQTQEPATIQLPDVDLSVLEEWEIYWRDHQKWLEERGYMLRPRYHVGWTPTWKGQSGVTAHSYEDSTPTMVSYDLCHESPGITSSSQFAHILDATRIRTGELVTLKRIKKSYHLTEIEIMEHFSSEPLISHPRNHCIPLIEVLDVPDDRDEAILVLPMLRPFRDPPMETVGEAVEFFRQVFEGSCYCISPQCRS